jgi:uncharacterized protein (DUF1800 family)
MEMTVSAWLPRLAGVWLAAAGLNAAAAIGEDAARHLLNRTGFAASARQVAIFAALDREAAVARLLNEGRSAPGTAPPSWVDEPIVPPYKLQAMTQEQRQAELRKSIERGFELREWWFREMLDTPSPLTERMTLFWHNHFATSQRKVRFTPLLYRQNLLLRRHALGNFGTLLREIARDPAMLIYLDGANSRKGQPNENFARELMELFTLGEGHYTEADVKDAARAFTGWSVDRETGEFVFRRGIHDFGRKAVLGKTGRLDGDQVIDILLARPETAEFIAGKLWREFVSPRPDAAEISRLAARFRESGYDIGKLMHALLTSEAFFAVENRATLIKSPVELVIGTLKLFEIEAANLRPFVLASALLGQNLFAPPNVKGWPGGEHWINSASLLGRKQFIDRLFRSEDGMAPGLHSPVDPGGRETRMQRQMERQMGGLRWDLERWCKAHDGTAQLQRLVLAAAPQQPGSANARLADQVRRWVQDPAYQLK